MGVPRGKMAQHERPSLAHLADKFNTDAPAGYVAGRGRGVAGFSKPPPEPKARGKKRGEDDGAADAVGTDEGISGEAADTRELDLGETEKYEQAEVRPPCASRQRQARHASQGTAETTA